MTQEQSMQTVWIVTCKNRVTGDVEVVQAFRARDRAEEFFRDQAANLKHRISTMPNVMFPAVEWEAIERPFVDD
jgi:hypothetical protein